MWRSIWRRCRIVRSGTRTGAQAVVGAVHDRSQNQPLRESANGRDSARALRLGGGAGAGRRLGWAGGWDAGAKGVAGGVSADHVPDRGRLATRDLRRMGASCTARRGTGGEASFTFRATDETGARELGIEGCGAASISKSGELAIRLKHGYYPGYARSGTLARVPLSGGTPREVLDNVQDADWAADGEHMAVVRYVPENRHWRLEYPVGKVLLDGDQLDQPAEDFAGREVGGICRSRKHWRRRRRVGGGDRAWRDTRRSCRRDGHVAGGNRVVAAREMRCGSRRPAAGSAANLHAVTLAGKQRTIANVPGGMWLQDMRDGVVLTVANQTRLGHARNGAGGERGA